MRVIKALENSFETHGIKIVAIFRMIPGNKMSQNYFLAVTKLKFRSYIIGTYAGSHTISLITAYIGTQIKSVEEVVNGGSEHFSVMHVVLGALVGIIIISLMCAVIKDARQQLNDIMDEERDEQADNIN